jgi:fructose-bisphosphate aldolase, class I
MSFLGKEARLNRLMSCGDDRYCGISIDHSMARGVFPELADIQTTIDEIASGSPDGITMHKGIARNCFTKYAGKIPLVLKCSTFTPLNPYEDIPVAEIEEGIRLGADAISVGCIIGGDHQVEQIHNLSTYCEIAERYGMPIITHIYPRGNLIPKDKRNDLEYVLYATRVAAELGVDLIKTDYTGDKKTFAKVVAGTPSRVLVAGGAPGNAPVSYFQMTRDIIDVGGKGITFGRVVFGNKNPGAMVKTLKKIIHENYSVKEAEEFFQHEINSRV